MAREVRNLRTATPLIETSFVQNEILNLRREGLNFAEIARKLDYSETYIKKLYKKALKSIIVENVESVRKMEMFKLDALEKEITATLKAFHPIVNSGNVVRDIVEGPDGQPLIDMNSGRPVTTRLQDFGPRLAAVSKALQVMERRAKLLGLDMPTKTALTNPEGTKSVLPLSPASLQAMEGEELTTLLTLLEKAKNHSPAAKNEEPESDGEED